MFVLNFIVRQEFEDFDQLIIFLEVSRLCEDRMSNADVSFCCFFIHWVAYFSFFGSIFTVGTKSTDEATVSLVCFSEILLIRLSFSAFAPK